MMNKHKISYTDAGVDVEKGDLFVERIKKKVHSTYGPRVVAGVGGFACLYEQGDKYLAAGTDGVGTKVKIAQLLNRHNTIGIDLVAMCANDIICTGARPLFFLDYFATGKLDLAVSEAIIDGIVEGCRQSSMALIGGETAEMPGMYPDGEYDLAGFAVGEVAKQQVIDGTKIMPGQVILGLPSSGVHSNGYSLVRRLINPQELELNELALTPTKIYVSAIEALLSKAKDAVSGLAHLTGGGIQNIPRLNSDVDYQIDDWPTEQQRPAIFQILQQRSGLSLPELVEVFNMGVGFVVIGEASLLSTCQQMQLPFYQLGQVVAGAGNIQLRW